jgi:hypothetical protein
MQLHAANLAIAAGAEVHEIGPVREQLAKVLLVEKSINLSHAKKILESLRLANDDHESRHFEAGVLKYEMDSI